MKHIFVASIPKRIQAFLLDLLFVIILGIIAYFPFSMIVNSNQGFLDVINQYEQYFDESHLYTTDSDGNYILYTSSTEELNYADYSSKIYYYYSTFLKEKVSSEDSSLYDDYWFNVYVLHLGDELEIFTGEETYDETMFTYQNDRTKLALTLSTTISPLTYDVSLSDESKDSLSTYFKERYQEAADDFSNQSFINSLYTTSVIYSFIAPVTGLTLSLLILCLFIPLTNSGGKTLGKMILNIVVLTDDGYTLPRYRTLIRFCILYFIEICLSVFTVGGIMLISYTMMNFAKKRRCMHDFIANSCVADAKKSIWFDSPIAEQEYILEMNKKNKAVTESVVI